jgi:hypothetical protein
MLVFGLRLYLVIGFTLERALVEVAGRHEAYRQLKRHEKKIVNIELFYLYEEH